MNRGMKMVCASVVVALFMLLALQFGVESGLSKVDVEALRVPLALHNIIGDIEAVQRARRDVGGVPAELQEIDEDVLLGSVSFAEGVVARMSRLEDNLASTDIRVHAGTPAHGQLIDSYPHIKAVQQGKDSLVVTKASLFLAQNTCQRFGHDDDKCGALVASMKLNGTRLGEKCAAHHGPFGACERPSKYRTVDGSCNNPSQQSWGKALTGYQRLIFPHYGDGIQEPRRPVHGRALPSARKVSTLVTKEGNDLDGSRTLAVVQWAQFVEHDLVFTPASKMVTTGDSIMCCRQDGSHLPPRYVHPSCYPISIASSDPFYSQFRVQCMNYVRSVSAFRSDCSFGPVEQLNQATHFLDGSMLYGSTTDEAQSLRTLVKGKLRSQFQNGQAFLPLSDRPTQYCQLSEPGTCYKAGDMRVNMHPDLVVMHTVWLREHNRVAGVLAELNPHWGDETLYQEARRVVVAEMQHITFKEWLPSVVGEDYVKKMGLQISGSEFSVKYDENINPTVSNSFATAAIRFLYSMMDGDLKLYDEGREANQTMPLLYHFNKPQVVEESKNLVALVRGLATQSAQKNDLKYVDDVKDLLYKDTSSYGMDVVSLDIQRGRDHGIPAYNYFRKLCGLPKAKKFSTFEDVIPQSTVQKLSAAYAHPDDVDLLVGGMAERPAGGGLLGPTLRCVLGEQMARTRKGDRYFYDLAGKPGSFSAAQLREIKKVTLARIFCDNANVETMQPNVFQRFSLSNGLTSCQNTAAIPRVSLNSWREVIVDNL
ncbi:peroxidase-like isoform X2 [Bacillus rossius redtenbacheri]|uniref:peroxidase-like isoform X2 n=1 Tax=Bacillus rossius redtenbacheri TaxID=93214 RepID=UPI002FDF02A4